MNKKILAIIFVGILILGVGIYFLKDKIKKPPQNRPPGPAVILFYGTGCPHCEIVEKYLKDNKVEEKILIEKKEVFYNKKNADEFNEKAEICGVPKEDRGVPLLWDGSKCIVGDPDIIAFFKSKIGG